MFAFIGMPGPMELLIIAGIVILIFGPKQLPKIARSLGSALPSFQHGIAEAKAEIAEFKKAEARAEAEAHKVVKTVADAVVGKSTEPVE
jgi:sec-independent protein translocase protein TatA